MLTGVYLAYKKDGEKYYRSSITYLGKHISLGSYDTEIDAHKAYLLASKLLNSNSKQDIDQYPSDCILSFDKWVVLNNYRDNQIYFKTPIYLKKNYFLYYIDKDTVLKFDVDDLFYYAHHKIQKRGGHLFVSDYGMQVSLASRYGIKPYSVLKRDYLFANGDCNDYRYGNIIIINRYQGVSKIDKKGKTIYLAKINIRGEFIIGYYSTEEEAAIAYNKAALLLKEKGLTKNFILNYIEGIDEITYASMYQKIKISKKIRDYIVT